MRRLVALLAVILIGMLAPPGASAQDVRVGSGMGPDGVRPDRPPSHRARPPLPHRPVPGFPCCVGWSYLPTEPPPPMMVVPPPPIVYVVPAPPT
ncbi:MAG: hypothetical protein ACHQ8D_15495, partial [Candidatus Rokuibacteriota bacterium]